MTEALVEHPLLTTLAELIPAFPEAGELFLVGGAVRDALLGRPVADFDFTSPGDPTPLARALARQSGGHCFWLDAPRRQSRVLIRDITCDFAPFRAPTLAADLAARDFTINAMALDLSGPLASVALIDPLGGQDDLAARRLRCAGPGVLHDDPLRILKGIRHAVEFGLAVDLATMAAMQAASARLTEVAVERLRLELWRILAAPQAPGGIELLARSGGGEALLGAGFIPAGAELSRRLRRAAALFTALTATVPVAAAWLSEPVEQGLDRATLLRWHCVLEAIDPPLPLVLARNWRFSRAAAARLAALAGASPQLWSELAALPARPRATALWALHYGPDPVDLLLALGLNSNEDAGSVCASLAPWLRLLAELPDPGQVPALVDGRWMQAELGAAGEEIGILHAKLRAAEVRGVVRDVGEAHRYLLQLWRERG